MMSAVWTTLSGVFRLSLDLGLHPAFGQVVGGLVAVLGGVFEGAADGGEVRELGALGAVPLAIFRVAADGAVAQAQRERGVGIGGGAFRGEANLGDGAAVAADDRVDFVVVVACGRRAPRDRLRA